ncbi:MAG: DUF4738 domain-containing protein [Bacteroides sp.]
MNRLNYFGIGILVCLFAAACSSSTKGDGSKLTEMSAESAVSTKPERMQVSEVTETFTLKGGSYQSTVVRRPDESLPIVTNSEGAKFVDNRISLRITSQGRNIVDRVFTKQDFASLLNARFMKYAILEGLVFDQVTEKGMIRYAASVAYPQSDLYVPIRITVTPQGQLNIEREEMMDEAPVTSEDTENKPVTR